MPGFAPSILAPSATVVPGDDRARLTPADGWSPFGDFEQAIPARFALQVRRHADRPAVRMGAVCLSYRELAARAYRIAHAILARRGDREEPVALLLEQGPGLVAAILGALAAGKIYVPLDPAHPPERNLRALADAEPALLLASPAEAERARAWIGEEARVLDLGALDTGLPCTDPRLGLRPDRLTYVFYTSGSTGRPKGVADCHRNVLHNVLRYTDSLRIGWTDRLTLLQSCACSGSVSSLFAALLNGAGSHLFDLRREGIQGLARRIEGERVTMFHGVPAIFRELAATSADLTSLRVVRLEGDLAGPRDAELFQRRFGAGCSLVNGLGATETGLSCQYFLTPDSVPSPTLPIGYPTAGVEVDVADGAGGPAATGEIGEIVVQSRYLAVGYWRDPALTEARFRPGPGGARRYRTGDLGRRRGDGAIELLGRKDLQVKLRGEWVDTAAIEAALLGLGLARDAVVLPREVRPGRPELVAYLVAASDPPPEASAVRAALAARHPGLPLPTRWQYLRAMPQDANGKLDRAGWAVAKVRRRGVALAWAACGAAGWRMPAWLCDAPDLLRLAEARYRPRPAEDRAVVVCASALNNQAGWEWVARGGVEVVLLPGQPGAPRAARLVEEPYVDLLAAALRRHLRA